MQEASDIRSVAENSDSTLLSAHLADAADQRTKPSRVHELHTAKIDDQAWFRPEFSERLTKLGHGIGIEFTIGAQLDEVAGFGSNDTDLKHNLMVPRFYRGEYATVQRGAETIHVYDSQL